MQGKIKQGSIYNKYVCKFNGVRDHDFLEIENDSIVNIRKNEEIKNKLVKTNCWTFELDRVYDESSSYQEIFENEIILPDFFSDIYKGLKSTFTFVGNSLDSFFETSEFPYKFLEQCLSNIFTSDYSYLPYKYMKNSFRVSLSCVEINDNKLNDFFNFDSDLLSGESSKLKIIEFSEEIVIDGVKEILINSADQFESLIKIAGKKRNLHNKKKQNKSKNNRHELITLKVYEFKTKKLCSKINFLLYKAYDTSHGVDTSFTINTKENFNFFQTFHQTNFRTCKITRLIKDTLVSNKNITIISLPISLDYIILIHDILNYIKMRKVSVVHQSIPAIESNDTSFTTNMTYAALINEFNGLCLEDKENSSIFSNKDKESLNFQTTPTKLNLARLKKIADEDKPNIQAFLENIENNI